MPALIDDRQRTSRLTAPLGILGSQAVVVGCTRKFATHDGHGSGLRPDD